MRQVTVLKRDHAGMGLEVEWVMGIFGITSLNVMKYYHASPHSVEWVTISESKGIKHLHGRCVRVSDSRKLLACSGA
jgi:hypothetical protein